MLDGLYVPIDYCNVPMATLL